MSIPSTQQLARNFAADVRLKVWRVEAGQSGPVVFTGARKALFDDLMARFAEHEAARAQVISELKTKAAVLKRARWAHGQLRALYGLDRLPARTPLKARVSDGFRLDGCRVERVIFESRPQLFVTANLYFPEHFTNRLPAVLHVCGHAANGKAAYQDTSVGLARRGMAVLAIDPAGQGERDEYVDRATGKRTVARACRAHGAAGDPMYLTGSNFGHYRLWDCMRALDYLQSRPELDPTRIGVTGRSGGGWESLWLAALDRRVSAVNSNCYLTTLRRRVEARHEDAEPDPEQDPFGILARGLDLADVILACLPHCAVSVGATIFDFFPIDGALACYREAKGLFKIAGATERLAIEVADAGHANTPAMQRQCFSWLSRWLRSDDRSTPALLRAPERVPDAQTFCTPTGIVLSSLGGTSTSQLHAERARELALARKARPLTMRQLTAALRRLLRLEEIGGALEVKRGASTRLAQSTVSRIAFDGERNLELGGQLWEPAQRASSSRKPAVLYLAEKAADYAPLKNLDCKKFAAAGNLVLDFDPRGMEAADDVWLDFVPLLETNLNSDAFLLGKPLLGLRVADVLRAVDVLCARPDVDARKIRVYGEGYGALLALFAGAIDPRITAVTERRGLWSYASLCFHREYAWPVSVMLPSALVHFDLPELRLALKREKKVKLLCIDPLDHLKKPL